MHWKQRLTEVELADLERLAQQRDEARKAYNALACKLKTRADGRTRLAREREAKQARGG